MERARFGSPLRWLCLIVIAWLGFRASGISGAIWALTWLGLVLFVFFVISDGLRLIGSWLQRPQITQNFYNEPEKHPDVEGTSRRHPDPTRPTDDDEFAGLITYRISSGRKF